MNVQLAPMTSRKAYCIRAVEQAKPSLDDGAEVFGSLRRRLLGIAVQITGSWTEAEDVVQDAWVRWQRYERTRVRNSTAFLVTTTTRLAINATQSARARRESYLGEWGQDSADPGVDPASGAVQNEALELGILLLMERLSPSECAAYVLRRAFGYPYSKIADLLQLTEANARQLVSRSGKHLAGGPRQSAQPVQRRRLLNAFLAAARTGQFGALEELFGSLTSSVGPTAG
jgi:RNA polymerase sigma-70 factor (ECF subfamily)